MAQDGAVLTEAQLAALKTAKAEKDAHGAFENQHPGSCGAQDSFYVGMMTGVGRIHQQTFIDTYSKRVHATPYDRKTPITAADVLNHRGVPFPDAHDVPLLRILNRPGNGPLRQPRTPPIRPLPRRGGYRSLAHQDQEPTDQWHRRAVPQDGAQHVLPHRLPKQAPRRSRRATRGSRRMDQKLHPRTATSGTLVLRHNTHGNLP